MRNFLRVFKLQATNILRRTKKGSTKRFVFAVAGLAILYLLVAFMFVSVIMLLGSVFVSFDLQSEFIALILMAGLLMVLIFGIVAILTCLYFAKDSEFFLSLPVKPSTIYAAKLAVVYVTELIMAVLIMLPCLIAAGVCLKAGAVFYVIMPFAILLTPAIPLCFASIIAIPIMYIASFFKNRGALGSIAVIVLFAVIFGAYYIGVSKMQNTDPETIDLESVRGMFGNICNIFYPLYALSRAMTAQPVFGLSAAASVAVNSAICLGSIVAISVIAMLISSAVYKRGMAAQLEGAKKTKTTNAKYRNSGTLKALLKKEWREIIRTPAFALNCLLVIVVCPIIVGFMGFTTNAGAVMGEAGEAETEAINVTMYILRLVMLWLVMFMGAGMNASACTAFTREGEKFIYCKMLPVDAATQIKAKAYISMIIGSIAAVVSAIVMAIADFDAVFFICSVVLLLLFVFATVHLGLLLDLNRPKIKWVTHNEALKHNRNVMLSMFISLAVSLVIVVLGGVLYLALYEKNHIAATVLSWLVMFILAGSMAAICYAFLYKDCDKKINAVEA